MSRNQIIVREVSTMNTFEGIRYPIGSAEINKHQIGFGLSSDEGMLEVDTT